MSRVMLPWSSHRRTSWSWRDERLVGVAAVCAARGVPARAPGAVVSARGGHGGATAAACFARVRAVVVGSGGAPGDCEAAPGGGAAQVFDCLFLLVCRELSPGRGGGLSQLWRRQRDRQILSNQPPDIREVGNLRGRPRLGRQRLPFQ